MHSKGIFTLLLLATLSACGAATPDTAALFESVQSLGSFNEDVDQVADMNHRNLQQYTDPVWFKSYKKMFGRKAKRCKFLKNVAPANKTVCPSLRVPDYICLFGNKECPDGSLHPDFKCDCNTDSQWECSGYDACPAAPVVYETCPAEHPLEFDAQVKCKGDFICNFGIDSCCRQTYPQVECVCLDGMFQCKNGDKCRYGCPEATPAPALPAPNAPPTPAAPPSAGVCPAKTASGETCDPVTELGKKCEYGEFRCCPNDEPKSTESCECDSSGKYICAVQTGFFCNRIACEGNSFPVTALCPNKAQIAAGTPCEPLIFGNSECKYGESKCCPDDTPQSTSSCSCGDDGQWLCTELSFICPPSGCPPPKPVEPTAPPTQAAPPSAGVCPATTASGATCDPVTELGKKCEYGEFRCCPNDEPKSTEFCECDSSGKYMCAVKNVFPCTLIACEGDATTSIIKVP